MANSSSVTLGPVRLSFLNVFQPRAMAEGQAPKYSACILIPKDNKKLVKAAQDAIEAARLGSADKFNGKVPASLKSPMHDGDGEMPNGGEYGAECKGMYVLNASAKDQPHLVDRQVRPIMDQTELYSGVWANVGVNFYAYNNNGNKGIACGLNGIQKVRDDESLGGRKRAEDMFSAVEEDDDLGL